MLTNTHNFMPADLLVRPKPAEEPSTEQRERTAKTAQPETRLWKLTAKAVQPKLVRSELLVLLIFLAVAASATVVSVQELSRLIRSNAIEHVATRALQNSDKR